MGAVVTGVDKDLATHRKQNVEYWRARSRVAVAECARLQQALAKADKAASKAHDAMWAMDFDKTSASSSERDAWKRLREQASDAIWAIHNLLRPLMAREALAGPDTPADDEPCSCCDGEGCAYCTPADSQEDKT